MNFNNLSFRKIIDGFAEKMSQLETFEKLVIEAFEITRDQFTDETTPDDLENWDSVVHMDLCAKFDVEFDISLDVEEIAEMLTIGLMKDILRGKGVDL